MSRPEVRRAAPHDVGACRAIVEGLPTYFTEDVPDRVVADLARVDGWVVEEGGTVLGCCVVERRGRAADVLWIAVRDADRGRGLGTALLARALAELHDAGVALVAAWTLDPSEPYEPYVATRAFWSKMGFVQVATIDPMPAWQSGNPGACYVAALEATASP